MAFAYDMRRTVRTVGGPMLGAALIVYFGLNAFHGDSGVLRIFEIRGDIARAEQTLEAARARRTYLETRVGALRSDRLDPDYLDERARLMTGLVGPGDVVLTGIGASADTGGPRPMVGGPPGFSR